MGQSRHRSTNDTGLNIRVSLGYGAHLDELHAGRHVDEAGGTLGGPLGGRDADEAHHEVQVLLRSRRHSLRIRPCTYI